MLNLAASRPFTFFVDTIDLVKNVSEAAFNAIPQAELDVDILRYAQIPAKLGFGHLAEHDGLTFTCTSPNRLFGSMATMFVSE